MPENRKFIHTGFGKGTAISDELRKTLNYCRSNLTQITQSARFDDSEMHLKTTDSNGISTLKELEQSVFVSFISDLTARPVQT